MRFSSLASILSLTLLVAAQPVLAKRVEVSLGDVKTNGAIVVATLDHVEVTRGNFSFSLKIAEVLRGRPDDLGKQVQIDHCSTGQNGQWEFGQPVDGMKVIAYLCRNEDRAWELVGMSEVVEVLEEPGKPPSPAAQRRIRVLKKNIALMDIADPKQRLEAVKRGLRDPDSEHQQFCVSILADVALAPSKNPFGMRTGVDLSDVLAPEMALSLVWEVYTAADTPLDTVMSCDAVFDSYVRRLGSEVWGSYPPRYRILLDAIKRHIASGSEIPHNSLDGAVIGLCGYPEHARETYEIILDVIGGKIDAYKFAAAIRLEFVYHPRTADPELRRLNQVVWAKMIELLADKNKSVANGAATAIGGLAADFANTGEIPDEILSVVDGRTKPRGVDRVAVRLVIALREVRAIQSQPKTLPDGAQGAEVLAAPWEHYFGRKVLVRGEVGVFNNHYAWIQLRMQVLRLALRDRLPGHPFPYRLVAVGTLTESYDVPVFRYERGEPFGKGLPVPEGFSLHDASRRFTLVDVSWRSQ